jgi:hypothetical protein
VIDDVDAIVKEETSHADDGSTQNVVNGGHSRFELATSNDHRYEGQDGHDTDEEEEALQADD